MTTDPITREDLEMAAKAAGLEVESIDMDAGKAWVFVPGGLPDADGEREIVMWFPPEDDGDCARMEDAVGIDVCRFRRLVRVCVSGQGIVDADFADHDNDRSRARRYASVKLAAAVGRGMA